MTLDQVERLYFERFAGPKPQEAPAVFILGSPRTGSTPLYQMMANAFELFYLSNFVSDHFAAYPAVGAALEMHLNTRSPVSYRSAYGKTQGHFEPSEASPIFSHWFGGAHPSQLRSTDPLPGKAEHLANSLSTIYRMSGRPVLAKNAWNCFRVKALAGQLTSMRFIWIRRDIRQSALSDLKSRRRLGDPNKIWNSATTANYKDIQKRPYWEQVVEQQYEYNRAIGRHLAAFAPGRYMEVWYEEVCIHPEATLDHIARLLAPINVARCPLPPPDLERSSRHSPDEDSEKIRAYVEANQDRLAPHLYMTHRENG